MTDPRQVAQQSIERHSKSFSLAAKLLPARARVDAMVVYAWCRRADDAVDHAEPGSLLVAVRRLQQELQSLAAGEKPDDPILLGFQEVFFRRQIPLHYPMELLAGMEMDATQTCYQKPGDILEYCYRVAGVVGLMMCQVLGVASWQALFHATSLGIAMQLTNIARDVHEDWLRGRLYLPVSWLPAKLDCWLESAGPIDQNVELALRPVIARLLRWADDFYAQGDKGIKYLDFRSAFAIRTARKVYSAIGQEIYERDYNCLAGRAHTSKARKIRLALVASLQTLAELPRRMLTTWQPQAVSGAYTFDQFCRDFFPEFP